RTDGDPRKRRQPTPDYGNGWADNGCRTRHGCEVVPPKNELIGGHVIHAVIKFVRWIHETVIESQNAFTEVFGISPITACEHRQANDHQNKRTHILFSLKPKATDTEVRQSIEPPCKGCSRAGAMRSISWHRQRRYSQFLDFKLSILSRHLHLVNTRKKATQRRTIHCFAARPRREQPTGAGRSKQLSAVTRRHLTTACGVLQWILLLGKRDVKRCLYPYKAIFQGRTKT